ncbi:MAG: Npt1/Npt2 family nucleotide transporter [Chlamydiales bacterium]|nr:Npt1/Npt2 family nucleotide transporter [Chlamydiales bacterium]
MYREERQFTGLRSIFWPIHRHENRMVLPMFLMLLFIAFNYSILRNMKDALVVTAKSSGAEVIPFIKVWAMLPMAVLMTLIYTKLASRYSQEKVFYILITGFLSFFALFLFVLYPNQDTLHLHATAEALDSILPSGFHWLVTMMRNWTFTGLYVMSELWGCIILTVLFWGFANEVTRIGDARRFYAVLSVGGNLAAVLAGQVPTLIIQAEIGDSVYILMMLVLVAGVCTMAIFRWMNIYVLNDAKYDVLHGRKRVAPGTPRQKLSMRESLLQLANSKHLLCIAALVVGYNLVINLVEVVWKDQLKQLYPSFADYNAYLGNVTTSIGIFSTMLAIFLPFLIRRIGWTGTALITPMTILVSGIAFFLLLFFKDFLPAGSLLFGTAPLTAIVFIGAAQNCLSKGCKYSVFDATKEMAFIPLDHNFKLKGKAAIDGVGSRFGKSGGSLLHQGLLMIFATLSGSAPYVAAILLIVIVAWIFAVRALGIQLHELVADQGERIGDEVEPEPTPATAAAHG